MFSRCSSTSPIVQYCTMQKVRKTNQVCPNCQIKMLVEVGFQDFGVYELLEIHCSRLSGGCGYAEDAEGNIRCQGIPIKKTDEEEISLN